ncbi:MAG TPA: dihydropteroate synthase [Terrimicrobiaceae bacterium]|nr:dihydropteroate synthase [Terrimicrobiaceae bacterium]
MELRARDRCVRFPRRPLIMGIVNINDDSFCGDGRLDSQWALEKARELVTQGADIVDVGGESARSNRAAITPEEELRRILPFLERFNEVWRDVPPRDAEQVFPPLLSVNTWRPEVAAIALRSSGHLLNDLSALHDDENAHLCAQTGAALLIIHAVGLPKVSHTHILYQNIIDEMLRFFRDKILLAERAGVPRDAIVLDPGIDFAKQVDDNLRIFRELDRFHQFGRPLLLPVSRKSVIGEVLGIADPNDRDPATAACIVAGMLRGAYLFRVHNVEMAWRVVVSIHRLVAG